MPLTYQIKRLLHVAAGTASVKFKSLPALFVGVGYETCLPSTSRSHLTQSFFIQEHWFSFLDVQPPLNHICVCMIFFHSHGILVCVHDSIHQLIDIGFVQCFSSSYSDFGTLLPILCIIKPDFPLTVRPWIKSVKEVINEKFVMLQSDWSWVYHI